VKTQPVHMEARLVTTPVRAVSACISSNTVASGVLATQALEFLGYRALLSDNYTSPATTITPPHPE
jgi:hypothetical protein